MTTLTLLALLTNAVPAASAAVDPMDTTTSQAADDGWTVVQIEAFETRCETYSVDENAWRRSTYRTWVSVDAVLSLSDDEEAPTLTLGESLELRWSDSDSGRSDRSEDSCGDPEFSLSYGQRREVVVDWDGTAWTIDAQYFSDGRENEPGDGLLPACGEDLQQQVLEGTHNHDDPEQTRDGIRTGSGQDGLDGEDDAAPAGCSTLPLPGVGPVAALLGLATVARRRRD